MNKKTTRHAAGFTLLEVLLAMSIAGLGVFYLYQGVSSATVLERRRRFYDRCSEIINTDLHRLIAQTVDGTRSHVYPPDIVCEVRSDPVTQVKDLRQVLVTFIGTLPGGERRERFITYYYPGLRTYAVDDDAGPNAGTDPGSKANSKAGSNP